MPTTYTKTQLTSPDITTASADLHDCTSWQTIHSLKFDHLPLLTILSIHHKTKTTCFHFTKTNKNLIGHYLNNILGISSLTDHTLQMFMRQTNTLPRQFWMLTDSLFLKKITTAQITLTYPCISATLSITITIYANKTDQTNKSLLLTIT